jgi:fibronectin-binding autotransporter adhesin
MKLIARGRLVFVIAGVLVLATGANAQRQMENLGRGVVAVPTNAQVYVGWRMLGTDPDTIGFNLYRFAAGGSTNKLNTQLLTNTTDFVDTTATLSLTNSYFVRPLINGVEQAASASYVLPANAPIQQYISIPLQQPPGGTSPPSANDSGGPYTYAPNDCSVADLDGDGEYEIILKWDPTNAKDNSQDGHTGPVYLDAYKLNGTRLWRINLGKNIRAGAHYTQFMVYDLDGDGKAEVVCKTAPGTVDAQTNNVIMPGDDPSAVYTNSQGYILAGPEYLTIFNGQTGAALVTTNYVPLRHPTNPLNPTSEELNAIWGDGYGNRLDRYLACVAYLDGKRPSLVMCRGYYTRTALVAWDWRNGQLVQRWVFDVPMGDPYAGQGNHSLSVGDVDGDGKDEIVYGACSIDHDGTGLYTTGWEHGDAMHFSDMDPDRPGLEVWDVHEVPSSVGAGEFRDAKTGALIFGLPGTGDTGRGCAANLTSAKGYQMWSSASGGLFNNKGQNIGRTPGSDNFLVWWDADAIRELLDGNHIDKYGSSSDTRLLTATECDSINGTKATPCVSADILGDWREEVIWRTTDNTALHIYTTTIPATNRLYTLMHDPQYRLAIAWQNVAYNQPPHPGFYLGAGMRKPPLPPISTADLVWRGDGVSNVWDVSATTNWAVNGVWTNTIPAVFNSGQSVLVDLSGSNNVPVSLVGALTAGTVTVYAPKDYVFAGSGSLAGTTTVVKTGTGTLTINTTNNYTGATVVSDGALLVNGTLGQSPVTVRGSLWSLGWLGGNGSLGGGVTAEWGGSLVPGNGTNAAGTLSISNGLTETGGVINRFDLTDDPSGLVKTNDRTNVTGQFSLSGTNTVQIGRLNSFLSLGTYSLVSYSGSLSGGLSNLTLGGSPSSAGLYGSLTNPPGAIALLVASNRAPASLFWKGGGASNWDTVISTNWWNGAFADYFFAGDSVTFTNAAATNVNMVGMLTPTSVVVNATVDYSFGGTGGLGGSGGLTKTNTGTLVILTTNGYTGATLVKGGALLVNGRLDQSAVTVASGGTIGGSGRLGQGLTVQSGGSVIVGNGTNVAGTLTISNGLTETGGVINRFDLTDDPSGLVKTNDRINVTGNLSLSGTNTIQVTMLNGLLSTGTYTLISYSGSLSGGTSNLTLSGGYGTLTNLPGQIALFVSGRGPANLTWKGGVAGNSWDTGVSTNWLNGGVSDYFFTLDSVTFTNTTATNVVLVGALEPASVLVNATVNYSFGGSGTLSGSGGLTKTNSGMLFIQTTNTYTGATVINGGTLSVGQLANGGAASAIGAAATNAANLVFGGGRLRYTGATTSTDRGATVNAGGGTIDVTSSSANLTMSGVLVDNGGLTKIGSGTLTLSGANSFAGGVTASVGTVTLTATAGAGTGTLTFNSGTVTLNASGGPATYGNPVRVVATSTLNAGTSGNNNQALSGAWYGSGTLNVNIASTFSVQGDMSGFSGTVTVGSGGTFRFYGSTGSSSATFNLGSGTASLVSRNGGTVNLGALSGSGGTTVSGATATDAPTTYVIGGNNSSTTFSGRITDGSTAARTTAVTKAGSGTLTLAGTNTYGGVTTISAGTLQIGNGGTTGTLGTNNVVNDGTLTFNRSDAISCANVISGSGSLTKLGGSTLTLIGANTYGGPTTISAGTLQIGNGGTAGALGTNSVINNGTLTFNRSDAISAGSVISGSGRLVQLGGGTLVLTRANTYSGGTTVSNGTLLANNAAGSGTGTGAVMVVNGATLGGSGTIGGLVTVNGTVAPGSSVGTLTISNSLVVNSGAALAYELGTASDRTVVSSNLTVGGTLNVTDSGGFTNGTYMLFSYGGTLTYNGVSIGSALADYNYDISTNTTGRIDLVVTPLLTPFQQWQMNYFGSTTNPAAAASADPDGDGPNNWAEFLSGTNPTNSLSALRIVSVLSQGNDVDIIWATGGGRTNAVQATAGDADGGYTTNFTDFSGLIILPGSGDATTNYVDAGGATNTPARYYRIRLVP